MIPAVITFWAEDGHQFAAMHLNWDVLQHDAHGAIANYLL